MYRPAPQHCLNGYDNFSVDQFLGAGAGKHTPSPQHFHNGYDNFPGWSIISLK